MTIFAYLLIILPLLKTFVFHTCTIVWYLLNGQYCFFSGCIMQRVKLSHLVTYIRVNDPTLNRNLHKYQLPRIWDGVLQDIPALHLQWPHTPFIPQNNSGTTPKQKGHNIFPCGKYVPPIGASPLPPSLPHPTFWHPIFPPNFGTKFVSITFPFRLKEALLVLTSRKLAWINV